MNRFTKKFGAVCIHMALVATAHAQFYQPGDIVEDLTFRDRETGETVSLYDLEGEVIFIEWFAHWCPFCQAAANQVVPNIINFYGQNTTKGVPFTHLSANLQAGQEVQTQAYVDFYGITNVVEDFGRSAANHFAASGQPIFAIINGVENSSSHAQWELVYSHSGYGNLVTPIADFRNAIDSVLPGAQASEPPSIDQQPVDVRAPSGTLVTIDVTASSDESIDYQWYKDEELIFGATNSTLTLEPASIEDTGAYHVVASNSAGSASSESIQVEIILSLSDYLATQGVPLESSLPFHDADYDGASNVLEYLSETDANDSKSFPILYSQIGVYESTPYLQIETLTAQASIGYSLALEYSSDIGFSEPRTGVLVGQSDNATGPIINLTRSPTPISDGMVFARLKVSESD